ncbi:hypothetical protein ACFW6P_00395 [Streptomyces sp. NPDC058741]
MAVPPMIGAPDSGGYVFCSGSRELFEEHRATLAVPAGTRYVGTDPGFAALHDVALLSSRSTAPPSASRPAPGTSGPTRGSPRCTTSPC